MIRTQIRLAVSIRLVLGVDSLADGLEVNGLLDDSIVIWQMALGRKLHEHVAQPFAGKQGI